VYLHTQRQPALSAARTPGLIESAALNGDIYLYVFCEARVEIGRFLANVGKAMMAGIGKSSRPGLLREGMQVRLGTRGLPDSRRESGEIIV
jgi:hypothetical protein